MSIESTDDLIGLQRAGRVVALALEAMRRFVRPGVTTGELDAAGEAVFSRFGARSAPQLAYGFPGVNCISLNDEAVHGVPSPTRLIRRGDLVKIDVTAELDDYMADAAITVEAGAWTAPKQRLIRAARAALDEGLQAALPGSPINLVGRAVEREVRRRGFSVIRELAGHGIGRTIHESPTVPNYCDPRQCGSLTEGLVLTIEPIIAAGVGAVRRPLEDGWTLSTSDGGLSAHVEHTIVIAKDRPLVLTGLPPTAT